jgi:cytochrome c
MLNDLHQMGTIRVAGGLVLAVSIFSLAIGFDLLWRGTHRFPVAAEWHIEGAEPERGRAAMARYGCGACHVIPGVAGARGRVGPKLDDFAAQIYIAGQLSNRPENLVAWLQNPEPFSPGTAMPNLGVSEAEARDMAAFLYSLR